MKWLLDIIRRWNRQLRCRKQRRYRKEESKQLYRTYDKNKKTLDDGGTL